MELEQKQLWTYLNWLHESGQIYARSAEFPSEADGALEPSEAPKVAKPPRKKLIFFSSMGLDSNGRDMVERIATALGLKSADFAISTAAEPLPGEFYVVLGQESADLAAQRSGGAKTLTIPHPNAMLKDPSLKRSAWDALQSLKTELA